jgi:hypothetical protein
MHSRTFADHVDGLVAGNRPLGTPKQSEMLTRVDPSFDRAVVLFPERYSGTAPVDAGNPSQGAPSALSRTIAGGYAL